MPCYKFYGTDWFKRTLTRSNDGKRSHAVKEALMGQFLIDIQLILASPYIAAIVGVALLFDFVNGFHDAANSVATIVGTKVLRYSHALVWAAFWNFVAAWVFGVHVANTVAKWVKSDFISAEMILAGLLGAIIWDLFTWWKKLPTSSSHALLGGFIGAGFAAARHVSGVVEVERVMGTVIFIVISPLMGFALATFFLGMVKLFGRGMSRHTSHATFKIVQLFSAAAYSLGHGTNDAQKTMGVIAALLFATVWKQQQAAFVSGAIEFPFWIVLVCHAAIALGTLAGGSKIIKTMAMKLTHLEPHQGACAEFAAFISLALAAWMGKAVSTTHTIVGAIVAVGSERRLSAVRWGLASRVVWAWIFTIPCCAGIGAVSYVVIVIIGSLVG